MKKFFTFCMLCSLATGLHAQSVFEVSIEQDEALSVTAAQTAETDQLGGIGLLATPKGGSPEYTYLWTLGKVSDNTIANPLAYIEDDKKTFMVRVTDTKGCTALASVNVVISSIDNVAGERSAVVVADAASRDLRIVFRGMDSNIEIGVVGINGQTIHSEKMQGNPADFVYTMGLSSLPSGYYVVQIKSGTYNTTQKIIVK